MAGVYLHLVLLCSAASVASAFAGAAFILLRQSRQRSRAAAADDDVARTAFLIEDGRVIDATLPGQDFLAGLGSDGWSQRRLSEALSERFPDLPAALMNAGRRREAHLVSHDGVSTLAVSAEGTRLRLTLEDAERDAVTLDRGCHAALERELEGLRAIGDSLPYPIWREDPSGRVTWVNRAYLQLVEAHKLGDTGTWPPPAIFGGIETGGAGPVRMQIAGGGERGWFDCQSVALDGDAFCSATPADALVAAEESMRGFVQSFSNTFAHLKIGLAVFDRRRQLILSNPALAELTTLSADLLVSRPTLDSFLDALRVRRVMPEPKDASNWREHVQDIEHAAVNGTYAEMWHLPGERTYRVSGRPQPGGAFALLIEEISAEIRLANQFRAQIEMGLCVLDALDEAVVAFDGAGSLVMSNAAYEEMWGIAPMDDLTEMNAGDAIRTWTQQTEPAPIWGEARTFLSSGRDRTEWSGEVRMRDGRPTRMTLSPLPDGGTLVRFAQGAAGRGTLIPLSRRRPAPRRIGA